MSEDSKSFEKKLDRDFLYYLTLTENLLENVEDKDERKLCELWLTHLLGKPVSSLAQKCDRNIYLSRLLLKMQSGKLSEIFTESPSSGPLPCAFTTFGLPTEIDGLKGFKEMGFQIDSSTGIGSGDFLESSRDGRTYLATRHLPQGIMAYLAVTNNEGEPAWIPQTCPTAMVKSDTQENVFETTADRYNKILLDNIKLPLHKLRKSPEERDQVLEWMDKIISDCNKWIRGEDPHNPELEQIFQDFYESYKNDPENSELLKHPKTVRTILFKDIRDKISERRAEISKREMILDHYESEQFTEEIQPSDIDEVWMECAHRPLSEATTALLESLYPQEVVRRFFELLVQERLQIIHKGEKQAKKKIAELRQTSIEDTKKELQKLKKAQNDYKEYYLIYKEVEEKEREFEREQRAKAKKSKQTDFLCVEKLKQEMECKIQQAKRCFDKEMKVQYELKEKLLEAKEKYRKLAERYAAEIEKLNSDINQINKKREELQEQIYMVKRKKDELQCKIQCYGRR